jgi:hypothetical protein
MTDAQHSEPGVSRFERLVARAALAAAPIMAALGTIAMVLSPHVFAESDSATGTGLWVGAGFGLAVFLLVAALPQLLFGLALRSGGRVKLEATAVGAPVWSIFVGGLPAIAAAIDHWEGVSVPASISAGTAAVLDGLVFVAARRGLRRLGPRRANHAAPRHR